LPIGILPAFAQDAATNAPAAGSPNAAASTSQESATNAAPTTNAASFTAAAESTTAEPDWTFHPITLTNSAAPGSDPFSLTPEAPGLLVEPGANGEAGPGVRVPNSDFAPIFQDSGGMNWANDLASHLLVVFNTNDPDSRELARYYASRRSIPDERVLGIDCPTDEEISRTTYDQKIRLPIVSYLSGKNWLVRKPQTLRLAGQEFHLLVTTRNEIWAIVLMRGVPLRIANDPDDVFSMQPRPAFTTNCAAVDNELALLPVFGLPLGGFVPNPFYDGHAFGLKRIGSDLARNMVLVTRLDAPTVAQVRRMIDDCLSAEQHRLAGLAVVDSRGMTDPKDGYTVGDVWLRSARDELDRDGWLVKFDDRPELLPPTDPCNQVAIYLGWYSGDAYGPWVTPPMRFVPGAIAYHLHSFSAATLRSETGNWVGPLIAHGADASMGMVAEPYLALTPHEDVFTRRLLAGGYFAEAAYAAEPALSWMLTVVGDPLYRPFNEPLESALSDTGDAHTPHDDWLLLQTARRRMIYEGQAATPEMLKRALTAPGTGPVAWEGLGDLAWQLHVPNGDATAERAYHRAEDGYNAPIDRVRVALKLAQLDRSRGDEAQAESVLDRVRTELPDDARRFGVPDTAPPVSTPAPATNAPPKQPKPPAQKQ
jgi:uncharacterized protein (TIGR03790 family)